MPIVSPIVGAALAGGGFNLLQGVGSGIAGAISAAKNRDWNEKMWHMQNEYNTPAAQMQRLKAAGLNENLMYGQMSSSNAGPVGSADVYNSKGWQDAISKIDLAHSAMALAKQRQELKSLKIENAYKEEQLDEFKNQREAEAHYSEYFSDYGKQMLARGYTYHFNPDGAGGFWIKDGEPATASTIKFRTFGYLLSKLVSDLNRVNTASSLNLKRGILTDTIDSLRQLDKSYLETRNKWQPYQYGFDMGNDALRTILDALSLRIKAKRPAPVYNNTYNKTYIH